MRADPPASPRHVLVTGAGRGIGREIALHLAARTGHSLTLLARTGAQVEQVARECRERFEEASLQAAHTPQTTHPPKTSQPEGGRFVRTFVCDAADPAQVSALPAADAEAPDVLVLNAGRFDPARLAQTSREAFESLLRDNLFAAVQIAERFLPAMKRRGQGLVIGVSSVGATRGLDPGGAYASAKHALTGYLRSLRLEAAHDGIHVSILHLGQTLSSSWDGLDVDPDRLADPEDVARLVRTLIDLSPRTAVEELLVMPSKGPLPI